MAEQDPKLFTPKRPRGLSLFLGGAAVLAISVIAAGLVLARNSQLRRQTEEIDLSLQKGPLVMVVPIRFTPAQRTLTIPGSSAGFNETPVYAKLPGYLKTLKVDKGDRVRAGEVLAIIESPETDKAVADAQANYWLQKQTDDRNQNLVKLGVVPQQTADESHSAMLRARAVWASARDMQAYEIIKAPFSGLITARNFDPGALVPMATNNTPATPIFEMATLQPLRVYAQVPQSQALFIRNGDPAVVTVTELPGRRFVGTVTRHSKMLSDASRTMLVEVDLPNRDSELYPGMYTNIEFSVHATTQAPLAPDAALVFMQGKTYLPIVRGHTLHLSPVTLGYDNGESVQILSGVEDNDLVAINMGQAVEDGQQVRPMLLPSASRLGAPVPAPHRTAIN
jgi:RND family efflux transporter MFP subunit